MELLASGGTAPHDSAIRGELFRAGKDGSNYKVRWFELTKKGDLSWGEGEAALLKGSQPLLGCQIVMEKSERVGKGESETRFGFSLSPPGVGLGRSHRLQATSLTERQLWVDALEKAAHPDAQRSTLFSGGRFITLAKQPKGRLGLELADSASLMGIGAPCVTVTAVEDVAAEAGLLVGDMVLMMGPTVLRNHSVALRTFANAAGEMTLRLAVLNREVRVVKRSGIAGMQLSTPAFGPGVIVSSLQAEGPGVAAGLHVGDRIVAIHGQVCNQGGAHAMDLAKNTAGPVLRLSVSGVSTSVPLRKDADGRLGLQFVEGTPCGSVQGAVVASVLPRSAARDAGLRSGDLVVAVDDQLTFDVAAARAGIGSAARGLTLIIHRPRVDAPDGEEPPPLAGRASSSDLDSEGRNARRQEWYFTTDARAGLPEGATLYEDLTAPV